MIHLFHGEESFTKGERMAALRAGIHDDPSFLDINVTHLEGRSVSAADLHHHCDVPPFLGNYRLVVATDLLTSKSSKVETEEGEEAAESGGEFVAWLASYLPTIPDTTHLVLNENKRVPANHKILKAIAALGSEWRGAIVRGAFVEGG